MSPDADFTALRNIILLSIVNKGNGYEIWQSFLLYIFVGYFGSRHCAKSRKTNKRWLRALIQQAKRSIAITLHIA